MEADMRRKMLKEDHIEAVIGLGPNLFYNSPMEAMILVGNSNKPKNRKGKVLFINGKADVVDNKGLAYMTTDHINKLYAAYKDFTDIPYFSQVAPIEEIMSNDGNMNINFYVKKDNSGVDISLPKTYKLWESNGDALRKSMANLFELLN